jgi:hypothetical protein
VNLATRRLIDASATLPPADRALLSLWTQRGLDDAAMARMTGMTPETIVERRERIVSALSDELGLPPQDITGALDGLADSAAAATAEAGAPAAEPAAPAPPDVGEPADPARELAAAGPEHEPQSPETQPQPEPENVPSGGVKSTERRRLTLAAVVLVLAAAAIVLIVLLAGGSSAGSAHTASTATSPSTTAAVPATTASSTASGAPATSAASTASSAPAASASSAPAPAGQTLQPLPGCDARAAGSVTLSGSGADRTLAVRVRGLPAPGADHYEVFLYNSIVDSQPLGALRSGVGSFRLPADAAHYGFIDISRQVAGDPLPDGASVLRAPSPAHTG